MIQAAVITVSDGVAAGTREDRSGPAMRHRLEELGYHVAGHEVVADDRAAIASLLRSLADSGRLQVIFTTGGTGIAARDITPEATRDVIEREIPGLPEVMRQEGRKSVIFSPLSRAVAGVRKNVLIVNVPGSPRGAVDALDAIVELVPHMVDLLGGRTEHP